MCPTLPSSHLGTSSLSGQPFIINVGNVNPSGKGQNGTVVDSEGIARTITLEKGEGQKILIRIPLKCGYSVEVKEESPDTDEIDVIGNYSKSNYNATPIVGKNGIVPTVRENHGQVTALIVPPLRIRKLTPKECFRLMGFTDEDFEKAQTVPTSDTQLYKQAGNSIVVDVLVHIFEQLFKVVKFESEEEEMKKNECKLIMAQTSKMFDLDKLVDKNPDLFNELCEKYPLKKECVYMIKYQKEEELKVEIVEEVKEVQSTLEAEETLLDGTLNVEEVINIDKPIEEPSVKYPDNFPPLYTIGEQLTISYSYDQIVEHITITNIELKTVNDNFKYYYTYLVEETGEVKIMAEQFLIDHEVLN